MSALHATHPQASPNISAHMAQRVEAAGSTDFFPTPPPLTRALCEELLPKLWTREALKAASVWEPACGAGHMAWCLQDYFARVYASDIELRPQPEGLIAPFAHDFAKKAAFDADFIITNPPFNISLDFILAAIARAKKGVAMLLPIRYLEGCARYNELYSRFPPALIGVFAERCGLLKGRWEVNAPTASAYIWVIWAKRYTAPQFNGSAPVIWLKPGTVKKHTLAADIAAFAGHDATRYGHAPLALWEGM